jgi:hypothetical protein
VSRADPVATHVKATCGCIGVVRDKASKLTGSYPFVSVRITVPWPTGHLSAGVTERWPPGDVQPHHLETGEPR